MISEHQQDLASLYALGALSPSDQEAFEAESSANPELQALTRSLQSAMAVVAAATPAVAMPPGLKDKVFRRVEEMEAAKTAGQTSPASRIGLSFAFASGESGWKPLPIPGASIKLLSLERDRGYAILLGKLEAGARYPAHVNAGPEDFYILTGDLVIGDRKLVAGDFHHADAGSQHAENHSVEGCTLIAVLTTSDPLVAFALSAP
jgi:anti-sigma factor ChrR (cupin superfamily)